MRDFYFKIQLVESANTAEEARLQAIETLSQYKTRELGARLELEASEGREVITTGREPPCPTNDDQEVVLLLDNGWSLVSGVYDPATDQFTCGEYVRLVDENGQEVVYWDSEEWAADPVLVMGAIINAAAKQLRLLPPGEV